MKKIGPFLFPSIMSEEGSWKPEIRVCYSIARSIMYQATTLIEGAWVAVHGPCPKNGLGFYPTRTLSESEARLLFPAFDGIPYRGKPD